MLLVADMVCSPAAEDISLLEEDDLSGVEANSPVIGVLSQPFSEELVVLSLSVAAACSYSGDLSATSSATSLSEEGEEVDELSVAGACLCLPKNNLTPTFFVWLSLHKGSRC